MQRLLMVLVLATVLIAAPAAADYSACMNFCKEELDFAQCHRICTENADDTDDTENSSDTTLAENDDCSTQELKVDHILYYIRKHYGSTSSIIYQRDGFPENMFEIDFDFYNPRTFCIGIVKVTDDCKLTDTEGNNLANERLRQRTFACEVSR